ncbi:hypothetical protein D3C78_1855680 [compost metagenome]
METFQLSLSGWAAARPSSRATTSASGMAGVAPPSATGLGAVPPAGAPGCAGAACALAPRPSFSRIVLNRPMAVLSCCGEGEQGA